MRWWPPPNVAAARRWRYPSPSPLLLVLGQSQLNTKIIFRPFWGLRSDGRENIIAHDHGIPTGITGQEGFQ